MNPLVGFFLILGLVSWVHDSIAAVETAPFATGQRGFSWAINKPIFNDASLTCTNYAKIELGSPPDYEVSSVGAMQYSNGLPSSFRCAIRRYDGNITYKWMFTYTVQTLTCPADTDGLGAWVDDPVVNYFGCSRTVPDVPACTAGDLVQSGFYNVGTVDTAVLPVLACNNGCVAISSGTVSVTRRALVGGVYNYYAGPANFTTSGETCTGGPSVPQSTASIDSNGTCASGQSFATMNGRTICIDSNTGQTVSPNSASAVSAAEALNQGNLQEAIGAASSAAAAAGLDVGTAAAVAAGAAAANQLPPDALLEKSFCEKNPSDPTCKKPSTFVSPSGARPDVSQSWYVRKFPDGVGGVMTASFTEMQATPLYGFLDSFRVQVNAAAFDGCFSFNVWLVGDVPLCIPSGVLTFISIVLTISALFAARSIIFGG